MRTWLRRTDMCYPHQDTYDYLKYPSNSPIKVALRFDYLHRALFLHPQSE